MSSISKKIKSQPVYNKKGNVIGGSIKLQDCCLEPGVTYHITINRIYENV